MIVRPATKDDAHGMAAVLGEIIAIWKSDRPSDPQHVLNFYIQDKGIIRCSVAQDADGAIYGFQVLKLADDTNPYGVTPGWGIIGTYVKPGSGRKGIGSALFKATLGAAQRAGLENIDAIIGRENATGLGYYEACGFRAYRETDTAICKQFRVPNTAT